MENIEEKIEVTAELKEEIINEYKTSQAYLDNLNKERGQWGDKYTTEKLPGLLEKARQEEREKVTLELQPEETEVEKRIKALEKSNAEKDRLIETNNKKQALSIKAKEIGFDIARAPRYSVYGENAEKFMVEDHEYMTTTISSEIDKKIKGSYDTTSPQTSKDDDGFNFDATMNDTLKKV